MHTIRNQQIDTLRQVPLDVFEERMVKHLYEHFPQRSQKLGQRKVREDIRYSMERAKIYGIVTERDVCKYLNIVFAFHRDFDTDPELPWAGEILNNEELFSGKLKVDCLHETALKYVDE
ncbi:MAG: hypothetical protein B6244_06190 [Candidatus Cloacimonetes bacterium 4572_55]|nr:MAG: hypothetical protein B6244_06190 [Candidatus Cloacimonetes bacterium 4572_55]